MTLSASSVYWGWEPAKAIDGLWTDPGWHNNSAGPSEYLRVDMGTSRAVSRVGYLPRVMSATDADGTWNGVYRQYQIYVTDDSSGTPANWGAPVASGEWTWPRYQERVDVSFTPKAGRYVYFLRVTAWGWAPPYGYASANEIWVYQMTGGGWGGTTTPMVTGQSFDPGAVLRNDFSGWVGFRFQVGSAGLTVTDLGRWVVSGNSGTHSVKLVQDNGTDVPGALATVSASGTSGQFGYSSLSSPVSLAANTSYYLVSQEVAGGDRWYNHPDCHLTLSGVASFSGPAWTYNSPTYYWWVTLADQSYVPVSLKYSTGPSGSWVAASETRYIYDGMLVLQERDWNNAPKVSYTRGVDLSGSRQGAGGIGGLLARSEHATSSPYGVNRTDCYHVDGNGNITAMLRADSTLSASYQYDPYGRVMTSSGELKDANVYRFSSKMVHPNSGLYYYGYRFYDPNLQRWPNRDPLGEINKPNLYQFVGNDPVNNVDPLGLYILDEDGFPIMPTGRLIDAYFYDEETKAQHDQIMDDAWNTLKCAGKELGKEGLYAAVPFGLGKVLNPFARFFFDARQFESISRAYWGARGGADGYHLHHWFIPQRWIWVPAGIRNGGWNLLAIPGSWNSYMNGTSFGPQAAEWVFRLGIPGAIGGAASWPIWMDGE